MIIQASMRTDIPAFYAEWFLNRLKAGFVLVRNPYDPSSVTRYRLSPEVVDAIGFCTKDPSPMLAHMDALKDYGQYWFVTITPYGRDIEPNVPDREKVMADVKTLSEIVGQRRVGWRYDPIFISDEYPIERHIADFEHMARILEGCTDTCVISFIDLYKKVRRNFPEVREVGREDRIALGRAFARIGAKYGMTIRACAEGMELAPYGVNCAGCMTVDIWEKALGQRLNVPKGKNQRDGACNCVLGSDVGAYDTCRHLCRYCYANADPDRVRKNKVFHDPSSPFLIGNSLPGDIVRDAKQESWIDPQIRMMF